MTPGQSAAAGPEQLRPPHRHLAGTGQVRGSRNGHLAGTVQVRGPPNGHLAGTVQVDRRGRPRSRVRTRDETPRCRRTAARTPGPMPGRPRTRVPQPRKAAPERRLRPPIRDPRRTDLTIAPDDRAKTWYSKAAEAVKNGRPRRRQAPAVGGFLRPRAHGPPVARVRTQPVRGTRNRRKETVIASKVFVGNLNFRTTSDQLATLFSEVGQVVEVFLPSDRNTGRPRGFAFVEYSNEAGAAAAIEKFDGHELDGRPLRVNEAQERPRRPPPMGGPRPFSDRGGQGGGGHGGGRPPGRPKGSRRNLRGKKRSL